MKKLMGVWIGVVFGCLISLFICVNATAGKEENKVPNDTERLTQAILAGMEITLGGCIEIEAGYEKIDYDDPADKDENYSDVSLATIELSIDAQINPLVLGHILFLYEEEPDADIEVDEGYIGIELESIPFYFFLGRQYIPFGTFKSHFISDPLTLELGETRKASLVAGFENDMVNLFLGCFNGDVEETEDNDNHIDDYLAGFVITLPGIPYGNFVFGCSYLSNIADSDALSEEIATIDGTIDELVPGYSAFVSVAINDTFFLEAETLEAMDEFEAGELTFDSGESYQPRAWNVELAYMATDRLEFALRYGGSSDGGDFLPETLYGSCLSYEILKNTSMAVELLASEYDNDDQITVVTAQLSVNF